MTFPKSPLWSVKYQILKFFVWNSFFKYVKIVEKICYNKNLGMQILCVVFNIISDVAHQKKPLWLYCSFFPCLIGKTGSSAKLSTLGQEIARPNLNVAIFVLFQTIFNSCDQFLKKRFYHELTHDTILVVSWLILLSSFRMEQYLIRVCLLSFWILVLSLIHIKKGSKWMHGH